jgi:hypothetical protein
MVLTIDPHKEEGNINFRDSTTILGSSQATLAVWGIQSPRVINVTRLSRETVILLEGGTLKRAQILFQEQESIVHLRKRGESSRNESQGSFSCFLRGQWPQGVGGGLFIAPTTKRAIGRLSTGQVQRKDYGSWSQTGQVR